MIEAQALHKRFGTFTAVGDVSFSAADGTITGLLGPNGAGKTTTLRMLYGLLRPDGGQARIAGQDVATDPASARRGLGVVTDSPGLYARLTAREHLEYSGRLCGLSGALLRARVEALLEQLGMGEIANRRAAGFSQGERRKVALGRALVHDPSHVILDEPTNGLDVGSARAVRGAIRELARQGKCVLFSSHVMQEVSALCDRVVVLAGGRVVATDTPAEILTRTGCADLESAFLKLIGSEEGLQ